MELVVVGIAIAAIGVPISYISMKWSGEKELPPTKVWWNIALSLFIVGALAHILFEVTGLNRKYIEIHTSQ